jgi:hypothetical protein
VTTARATRARNRGRRGEIETDLKDKYNVEFSYHSAVKIDEFDIDKSLANQARFESLDEATVERYKEAVERGDDFPAVIAYRPGKAANPKLVIIDGNHRLVAHERASQTPIDVYEVDRKTRPATITLMTYAFNTTHGRPTSEAERIHHAIYLVNGGASQAAAAAAVNISAGVLKREMLKADADKRARANGVDMREWESIASSVRNRLLNISTDEGFAAAVHLAYVAKLGTEEAFELVTDLNTSKSATKQRKHINDVASALAERIQDGGSGVLKTRDRGAMSAKGRIHIMLGQLNTIHDDPTTIAAMFGEAEKDVTASRLEDASQWLHKVAKALNPRLK